MRTVSSSVCDHNQLLEHGGSQTLACIRNSGVSIRFGPCGWGDIFEFFIYNQFLRDAAAGGSETTL